MSVAGNRGAHGLTNGEVKITGHRGVAGLLPENTIAGFLKACEIGCDAVEMDVRLTSDKELILMHDATIDRTTNGRGEVSKLTVKELKQFLVGGREPVPTFAEVLEALKDEDIAIQIELKGPDTEKFVHAVVESFGLTERVSYTSFFHMRVRYVKENCPSSTVGILVGSNPVDPVSLMEQARASNLHIHYRMVDTRIVNEVHASGKRVVTWGSVEDTAVFNRLLGMGVDAIGSNRPDLFIDYLRERKRGINE